MLFRSGLEPREEDLGLTLGRCGLGHGVYVFLPLLGPSSLRDGVGRAGDSFLYPLRYVRDSGFELGTKLWEAGNGVSLRLGEYEDLKESAIDPYVAMRDAYSQYRAKKLKE